MKYGVILSTKLKAGITEEVVVKGQEGEIDLSFDELKQAMLCAEKSTVYNTYEVPRNGEIYSYSEASFEEDNSYVQTLREYFEGLVPYLDKYSFIDINRYLPDGTVLAERLSLTVAR